jgi:hypothetical protein
MRGRHGDIAVDAFREYDGGPIERVAEPVGQRVDVAPTDPCEIDDGVDVLRMEQTAYHGDARSPDRESGVGDTNASLGGSSDWVDGFAAFFEDTDDFIEIDIDVDYDIPAEHVGLAVRMGADDTPGMDFQLNGRTVDTLAVGTGQISFGWEDVGDGTLNGPGYPHSGVDLRVEDNPHTVRIECTDGGTSSDEIGIDWIVLYDQRFYTNNASGFDNSTDSNDELSGPPVTALSRAVTSRKMISTPSVVNSAGPESSSFESVLLSKPEALFV